MNTFYEVKNMNKKIIGIDLGGTSIKFAILTQNGEIQEKWSIPTNILDEGSHIVPDIIQSIKHKLTLLGLTKDDFLGIGMGSPGVVNRQEGTVIGAYNLNWKTLQPIKQQIESELGLSFYIDNDANEAALGEKWVGAGNNEPDVVYVTLGTGVGGGVIAGNDGEIDILTAARQLRGFQFDDFNVFRVGGNVVFRCGQRIDAFFEFDPADVVEHHQCAGEVRRVVRCGNAAAFFDFVQRFQFARVNAQRCGGHLEDFGQVEFVFGFEVVQIGFVLEDVDVQLAFGQGEVGADVVGKFNQFDVVAFFRHCRLDLVFHHVAEIADGGADDDVFLLCGNGGGAGSGLRAGCFVRTALALPATCGQREGEGGN